ncbi:sensor histidine kinase [Nocardioides sp.]|uniref:sensor histidine kinase n=1 Tax=Nocardioides sp. TaxID=35761 RepID=UPI0039E4DAF1
MSNPPRPGSRPPRWVGPWFAAVWLFFLLNPLLEGWDRREEWQGVVGMGATLAFAAVYMVMWVTARRTRIRLITQPPLAVSFGYAVSLFALALVMVLTLGEEGLASAVYLAVTLVFVMPLRPAIAGVALILVATLLAGLVPGWGEQVGVAFGVLAGALAVFGMRTVMSRNLELMAAHGENTRLAVDNERNRFARDLHDILGHSLTVITVKAELAGRLVEADPARAKAEIADLERLSRDALADVRRAVSGYRELTLPGELARARAALSAAEIDAQLPQSTDEVPSELRELFAWTVREGVTNVIRHSGARHCAIVLTPTSAEIRDDGSGPRTHDGQPGGSGLVGLRERAAALGATVLTRGLDPGFSLQVSR